MNENHALFAQIENMVAGRETAPEAAYIPEFRRVQSPAASSVN
jgi:hypothetical protein